MRKSAHKHLFLMTIIIIPLVLSKSEGDARSEIVKMFCDETLRNNQTLYLQHCVREMEIVSNQIRKSNNVKTVVGTGPDKIYGMVQCYNDLSSQDCIVCYGAIRTVFPNCSPSNGGRIYLDGCFMRNQNYSFYEEYTGPNDTIVCGNTTRNNGMFQESTTQAMINTVTRALRNREYFATEEILVSDGNKSVYVLAQCWKTLSLNSCRMCLENASLSILKCLPWSEGRALNTGCFMRYSDTNFLNPQSETGSSSNRGRIITIAVSVISSVVAFAHALIIILYIKKRRYIQQKRKGSFDAKKLAKILNDSSLNFKYSTLEKATRNWDETNKIGQGGFGTVYKGVLLDGREIAVKRLSINNKCRAVDIYNEVNIISKIEHKNLVRLLGCSCFRLESILVYEYLPNKSLDHFIFDDIKGKELNWTKRFEIIIGIAEGLAYLHENTKIRIIHRDIKAANILLDWRLHAKIADFGLARSLQDDKSHLSTLVAGTLGYMAPEYLVHGKLTKKTDVYSFGVLLLEVVTGKQNNKRYNTEYADSLVFTVWKHFNQSTMNEIFDPNLMMHIHPNTNFLVEAIKVAHIALLCIQEAPFLRPTMSTALRMLTKDDEALPVPSNPPFIDEQMMELNNIPQRLMNSRGDCSSSVATISYSYFHPR